MPDSIVFICILREAGNWHFLIKHATNSLRHVSLQFIRQCAHKVNGKHFDKPRLAMNYHVREVGHGNRLLARGG